MFTVQWQGNPFNSSPSMRFQLQLLEAEPLLGTLIHRLPEPLPGHAVLGHLDEPVGRGGRGVRVRPSDRRR